MASVEDGDNKSTKRQNYAYDIRMRDAVDAWDQQRQTMPTNKPWRARAQIAKEYDVNENTLKKYTCRDSSKRRKLGQAGGRKKKCRTTISISSPNLLSPFI